MRETNAKGRTGSRVPLLILSVTALALLGWSGAGCDNETSAVAPGDEAVSGSDQGVGSGLGSLPSLTLGDLPDELNLTAEQADKMKTALARLESERKTRHEAMQAERPRGKRGDRRGGPGREGSRRGGPGAFGPAGPGDRERPMITFLEDASKALSTDQFVVLAGFLAERRAQMQPRTEAMVNGMLDRIPRQAARFLDLTDEQQESLRSALIQHGEEMRSVWASLEAGTTSAEQARDQAKAIRVAMKSEVQSILTEDQWARIENFRKDRRAEHIDNRIERLEDNLERRAESTSRILGLTSEQEDSVEQILAATLPARQTVMERVKAGTIEPEDAAFDVYQIEKNAAGQIRALLTPEQARRFDAMAKLLPRGRGPGPGMGLGMGLGPIAGFGPGMRGHR